MEFIICSMWDGRIENRNCRRFKTPDRDVGLSRPFDFLEIRIVPGIRFSVSPCSYAAQIVTESHTTLYG